MNPSYTIYVFPSRKKLYRLLVRLESRSISYKTYPDDISDGWVKYTLRRRVKKVYCVILQGDLNLAYELQGFGRIRVEAQALAPIPKAS
jgi:hypothetical protein